ncbi:L-rhamnose mutarotase [candidate division KSB1 bacterium]|nr:L-rhamnose mutarotase [candidate division KSB1 bacterium]RQW05018.1 MAG: L-rhamnose mutarotase [candidate division KSB1 bacterium]
MKRIGFKMILKSGFQNEYKRRHQNLWPELEALLKTSGISDYVIYLDEQTNILYASQKVNDDYDPSRLADHPVMRRWWKYMADIMETNADISPVVIPLVEMFYLE